MSEYKVGDFVVCTLSSPQATANTVYQVRRVNAKTVTILGDGGWEVNLLFNEVTKYQEDKKMSDFKVGDKVKCVKGSGSPHGNPQYYLEAGRVYTVSVVDEEWTIVYLGLSELNENKGEWDATRFVAAQGAVVQEEEENMTETEEAIYHLRGLLAANNATICITAEGVEVLRHKEDESFSVAVEDVDELLKALDVIEAYNE